MKTIKELRKKFIERNQLSPDFFTSPNLHEPDERLLRQVDLVHSLRLPPPDAIYRVHPSPPHRSLSAHTQPSRGQQSESKGAKQPLRQSQCTKVFKVSRNEPASVKVEKRRRMMEAGSRSLASLPKYATFLVKPCSVTAIKMMHRPQSSLERSRRKQSQLRRAKVRSKSELRAEGREDQLLPWEADITHFHPKK